ncbi:MAG: hypothetical protein QOE92_1886 [Chloroflexota bacterium]|jgi:glyoxylase-like metal-dependent hydrolase (beta-lactamase superfamily II)|nr:hypothetical protein [Chloroflexota bacterium]
MAQPAPVPGASTPQVEEFLVEPANGVSRVTDDIWCLSCPIPFDVGTVNVYLLVGDPLTLVDTGSRVAFDIDDLAALVRRTGNELADVEQLVLTHRHVDHFGLGADVKALSGCTVVSSVLDGPFMADWQGLIIGSRNQFRSWAKAFGIPDELFVVNEEWARAIYAAAVSVESDRLLREGDQLAAGGRTWRVIETPGHTEGLITFFDDASGIYLANDHVLRHITPNPDVYDYNPSTLRSGLPDYVESLARVRDLPATLVLPGHGHEMTDLAGRVDEILVHHDRRADKVDAILRPGPATLFEVVNQVWTNLRPRDTHLAVREIIGHVVLLERDGRVSHDVRDGVIHYSAV